MSILNNLGGIVGGSKDGQASGIHGDYVLEFPEMRAMTQQNLPEFVGVSMELSREKNVNSSISFDEKVVFPKMENLNLQGLHRLTSIYNDLGMLNSLALFECDNLKYVFSSLAAKALRHLEHLRVTACRFLEEIVLAESEAKTNNIQLPQVKTLILEDLPKLRRFCSGTCTVDWWSLKKVKVVKCPNIREHTLGTVHESNLEAEIEECLWHKEDDPKKSIEYLFVISLNRNLDPYETLTILDIENSDKLRTLEMQLRSSSFRKLVNLSARKCDGKLRDFLSVLILRSHELQLLEVKECKSLIQVFNLQNLHAYERDGKYFDQLKIIKLWDLPDLSCIWNKDPTGILGLHNLEEMEIVNCGFLKTIIPTSLAQHLRQLKVLKIRSCPTIEVVHMNPEYERGKREIVLPELQTLELVLLRKFERFHNPNCLFQFPSMQNLIIEDCPTIDAFTTGFLNAQSLPTFEGKSKEGLQGGKAAYPKMKKLNLKGLDTVEEIWQGSFPPESFSELKEVEVNAFGKLNYLIPSNMLPMLKDLEKLTIENCELITEVFQISEFKVVSTMLSKPSTMELIFLPKLLHIIKIEYVGSGIFDNLQTLVIKSCNSFQSLVFPSSCLHTLTKLEISECVVLKEIIVMNGESDNVEKLLFNSLKSFVLESLPELSTFFQGTCEFSSVEEISIINCPKLKTVSLSTKENLSTTAKFFTDQVSFKKLQKLHLGNLDCQEVWNIAESPKSLCESQELELGQSSKLLNISPSSLVKRTKKLKKGTVRDCEELKLAFDVKEQNEGFLPLLAELVLTDLTMMFLWRKEPRIPVFKSLVFLELVSCSSLETLFSISVAKNLEKLELLKLYNCEKMEYLLNGEAGSPRFVEFKKLKHLILKHLPSLRRFCEGDCDFKFPELEIVRVTDIPKMEKFAKGTQETPKLKEFYLTYVSNCWQGDLNKTIEYLHKYPGAENVGHVLLKPQTSSDSLEGDDNAIVTASSLGQEESNTGAAQENEDLISKVPEQAVTSADFDSQTTSWSEEKDAVSGIVHDGQLVKDIEEILAACEKRPGFLPPRSDLLRRELLQHPVLAGPFWERSCRFAVVSYELLAETLLVLEGTRNLSQMSDADYNAFLQQLEELRMVGFDQSWVDSLGHRVTN